jgi:hypothetical protein
VQTQAGICAIFVDMVPETIVLAEQHGYRRLKAKCIDFIVGNLGRLRISMPCFGDRGT